MGLDAILKRYFPAVIGLMIAIAAYFQASGMGELVAGSVLLDPSSMPPPPPAPKSGGSHVGSGSDRSINAGPILSRNPFDSVTGPLDGKPLDLPTPGDDDGAPLDTNDPYNDPVCDVAKVLLITESDDPDWSFAAIAGSDGNAQLRRRGDEVGGHQVYWIGWDRVWLVNGSSRCQMQVHGESKVAAAPKPAPKTDEPPKSSRRSRSKAVPKEIADKIHKVSETQFDVERTVVDQILENQAEFMRSARIVPEKEGDKIVGIRLFGVRPESLLGTLGLENGDRLQSINGFEMSDPQKALEAYARLRSADKLQVSVNRRGKPMTIDFNIK